jgi:hypothetical protein
MDLFTGQKQVILKHFLRYILSLSQAYMFDISKRRIFVKPGMTCFERKNVHSLLRRRQSADRKTCDGLKHAEPHFCTSYFIKYFYFGHNNIVVNTCPCNKVDLK